MLVFSCYLIFDFSVSDDFAGAFGLSLLVLIHFHGSLDTKEGMGNPQLHSVFQDLPGTRHPCLKCRGHRWSLFEIEITLSPKDCNIPFRQDLYRLD